MNQTNRLLIAGSLGFAGLLVLAFVVVFVVVAPNAGTTSLSPTPIASITHAPGKTPTHPVPTPTLTAQAATILINNDFFYPANFLCAVNAQTHQKRWCGPQRLVTVADDSRVYQGDFNSVGSYISTSAPITARDKVTGQLLWQFPDQIGYSSTPITAVGGIVYAWSMPHTAGKSIFITAIDANGATLWRSLPLGPIYDGNPPLFVNNGSVYSGIDTIDASGKGQAITYALDAATGQVKWQQNGKGGRVIAVSDSLVYTHSRNFISALDTSTGRVQWSLPITLGDFIAVAANGLLYVAGLTGSAYTPILLAIDSAGKQRWTSPVQAINLPNGLSVANGMVIALSNHNVLNVLDAATGTVRWHHALPNPCEIFDPILIPPLQGAAILVSSFCQPILYAFNASNGTQLWTKAVNAVAADANTAYGLVGSANNVTLDALNNSTGVLLWQLSLP